MDIGELIFILLLICIGWWAGYIFWYSPKAQIKRLWKQIHQITFALEKDKKEHPDIIWGICRLVRVGWWIFSYIADESVIEKKGKMINALLDYYFNQEEDAEFIEQNKYKDNK